MTDLEYINDFFSVKPTDDQKLAFERRIAADATFAAEVAFYLVAMQVAREPRTTQRKDQFKERYLKKNAGKKNVPIMQMWYMLAAVVILAEIAFGCFLLTSPHA